MSSEEGTTPSAPAPEVVTGKRERKQTSFFEAPTSLNEGKKTNIVKGSGIVLGEYPYFVAALEKLRGDDEVVKGLHSLMYNNPGKKLETKKNLRAFSGFSSDEKIEDKTEKLIEKKKLWTVTHLKTALGLFGLEKSGDRETLCKRLVEYLAKPEAGKSAPKKSAKKGTKSVAGKKRKSSKKDDKPKKKRALTAFMIFSNAKRAEVKENNPGIAFTEVGKKLGEIWNALNEADKKVLIGIIFSLINSYSAASGLARQGSRGQGCTRK